MVPMKTTLFILLVGWLGVVSFGQAQDDPEDPFDWRPDDTDESDFDEEDPTGEFDWKDWSKGDWNDEFEEYKDYYKPEKAQEIRKQAYDQAEEQGINMPQRHGPFTFDPQTGEVVLESEQDYVNKLNGFLDGLEDELTAVGVDMALELLYVKLRPLLEVLQEKNALILDAIIPKFGGVIVLDPVEAETKEDKEGKRNFKYWVKLAAESIMQELFKKNAEGKWELQRENVRLLKEVGIVRYLKMSVLDWELAQALELELPDEILDYAEGLRAVYQSGKSTFEAGKELYQEVSTLDTELPLPTSFDQLKEITVSTVTNQLTMREMVKKRQKVLALTYKELAERYEQYAEDLNDKLRQDDALRMTDGERLKAHHIAQNYLQQSLDLKAHAERLLDMHRQPHDMQHREEVLRLYATYRKTQKLVSNE